MDPAQLKASYDQTQYLSDMIGNVDKDLLKSQSYQNAEGLKSQQQQTQNILDSQERAQYASENRTNRGFQAVIENIGDKAANLKESVLSGAKDNLAATERIGGALDSTAYRIAGQTDQNIYRTSQDTRARMSEQFTTIQQDIYANGLEGQKMTNELIGYLKTNGDQSWSNFGNLTKDIYQGKADTILSTTNQYAILAKQASDNTSAIQLEALKNKADLAKQMAFEYSSLKDKISDSESSIKEVLRAQESDRLRDVLRATEHKSLYFELKNHHGHHRRHHHQEIGRSSSKKQKDQNKKNKTQDKEQNKIQAITTPNNSSFQSDVLLDRLELKEETDESNDKMEGNNATFTITQQPIPLKPIKEEGHVEEPIEIIQQFTEEPIQEENVEEFTEEFTEEPVQEPVEEFAEEFVEQSIENVQNILANIPIITQNNTNNTNTQIPDEPISEIQTIVNDVVSNALYKIDEAAYDLNLYKDDTKSISDSVKSVSESVASKVSKNPFDKIIKRLKKSKN